MSQEMFRRGLRRWADLEPTRCEVVDSEPEDYRVFSNGAWSTSMLGGVDPEFERDILLAVVEATIDRNWYYVMSYHPLEESNMKHTARVDNALPFYGDNKTLPMLMAYLDKLDQTLS